MPFRLLQQERNHLGCWTRNTQ